MPLSVHLADSQLRQVDDMANGHLQEHDTH